LVAALFHGRSLLYAGIVDEATAYSGSIHQEKGKDSDDLDGPLSLFEIVREEPEKTVSRATRSIESELAGSLSRSIVLLFGQLWFVVTKN